MPAAATTIIAAPTRLDAFVRTARPTWTRRLITRLVAEGAIRVNGRTARKGEEVRPGDEVTLPTIPPLAPEPGGSLTICYEDAHLVVVEKPPGTPAHALDPREVGTLANALLARYPETAQVGDPLGPGLAHRLDRGTSGLLIVARSAETWCALRRAFRRGTIDKRYFAVVAGTPSSVTVTYPLAHDPTHRGRMIPARGTQRAWRAVTEVTVLQTAGAVSLVEARMRTGVTHQVRAHLAAIGHPLLGDALYGGPACALAVGRHALHAARLTFAHPVSEKPVDVSSPLPPELEALLMTRPG